MEQVVFQNEAVKVTKITLAPSETTGPQTRADRVLIHLDSHTKVKNEGATGADQTTIARNAGDVHFQPASSHAIQNASNTPMTTVVVELLGNKQADDPSAPAGEEPLRK